MTDKYKLLARELIIMGWTLMIVLIIFLVVLSIYINQNHDVIGDSPQKPRGCFYEFSLSYECGKLNGSIIPVVENNESYWTCSKQDYKVKAC